MYEKYRNRLNLNAVLFAVVIFFFYPRMYGRKNSATWWISHENKQITWTTVLHNSIFRLRQCNAITRALHIGVYRQWERRVRFLRGNGLKPSRVRGFFSVGRSNLYIIMIVVIVVIVEIMAMMMMMIIQYTSSIIATYTRSSQHVDHDSLSICLVVLNQES